METTRPRVVRAIRSSARARYGVAVAAAIAAVLLRLALEPVWGIRFPFITAFPATMLSAWLGGLGPGIVTTLISGTAAVYFWIEPVRRWAIHDKGELLGIGIFLVVAAVISALNEAWRRAAATVAESEERLKITLFGLGDAVITTDEQARVTQLNPVAEALTGWNEADAIGQPLAHVFVIINEQSREPAANPVPRVLREGTIAGLANHTVLVARDGREIPIDDSAAPIRAADGSVVGAVLIFRDITERRRAERDRATLLEKERTARLEAERLADELQHVLGVTDIALSGLETSALMHELLKRVCAALKGDSATIFLLDPGRRDLSPVASYGPRDPVGDPFPIPLGKGVVGRVAATRNGMILDDLEDVEVIDPFLRKHVKSLIAAPLQIADRVVGVIHVGTLAPRRFTQTDLRLLAVVADRLAFTVERTRLQEQERAARISATTSEGQLRLALEAGRMGTWEWTIPTGDVKWSAGLEAIHGIAPGSFPGTFEAVQKEMHRDDRARVIEAISDAVDRGQEYRVEYRIVRPGGELRWVEGIGQVSSDSRGRPERMVGVCTDITERKQAEERLRVVVEAAPTAMLMINSQGAIILVNQLTEQLFGYSRNELLGQPIEQLVPFRLRNSHEQDRTNFFTDARQRAMGVGRDLFALRKDGTEIPVEIGLSPIHTPDGLCVIAAVSDITQRKRSEEALLEADRRKDEFLAMLSHELRNPINAVIGWAQMLRAEGLPAERLHHGLEVVERNARAEARLVESLLDVSRISAGKLQFEMSRVEVTSVVQAAADALRPDADTKNVRVELAIASTPIFVFGDSERLQQVMSNLLSNAVKFTPSGGHVWVHVEHADSQVRVKVADDGQGISPEFLPVMFDRFRQAETGKARRHAGLGLGLTLVREFVQAHGGSVSAHSAGLGHGSTFTVVLPIRAVATAVSERPGRPGPEPSGRSVAGLQVLVVDDDRDARELLALTLESQGAVVRTASSAADALDLIAREKVHVLLADIGMPADDGYTLVRQVRDLERDQRRKRLPAIAVTSYATSSDRDQALAAGYDLHLAKPVDPTALLNVVARFAAAV